MFKLEQIQEAHSKVKSGADFPAYIQDIKRLGVTHYETYVSDGHTIYYCANDFRISTAAKYNFLEIAETSDDVQFKAVLKAHQEGKTDYPTFCKGAAHTGIQKWAVSMEALSCTYYGKGGSVILVEEIPSPKQK